MNKVDILFKNNSYFTKEAYKSLRTNISFCGTDKQVICITSCEQNEGKSTISLELSKSLAEVGKRVLLIDADLRKSVMLSKYTNESGLGGLSQYLASHLEIDDVIYKTQLESFDIIFSGHYPPNPTELIDSARFKSMIDSVRNCYDYIIIDTPPLGLVIDAAIIAAYCDGAILVIARDLVKYSRAKSVKEQLEKSGCKLLGAIMNDTTKNRGSLRERYYKASKYYKGQKYSNKYSKY